MKELNIKEFINVCETDKWYQVKTLFGIYEVKIGESKPESKIYEGYFCDLEDNRINRMDMNTRVSAAIKYAAEKQEIYFSKQGRYYPITADAVET